LRKRVDNHNEISGDEKGLCKNPDNSPAYNALSIREVLAENIIAVLEQPPYSPDPAPCDFFLFAKLNGVMKGTRFPDVEAIKMVVTKELRAIPDRSFQECMEARQRRMAKCVRSQGHYIEGDMLYWSLQFVFGKYELCAQSRYFSNTLLTE